MIQSFYDWCIENDRQDLLDRWDYKLNKKSPKEVSFKISSKIYFKCPHNKHESTGIFLYARFVSGNYDIPCIGCNSFGQWGIDNIGKDFLEKYWDYDKNQIDPMVISKCSHAKIYIKCQHKEYHGSYCIRVYDFTLGNDRCPYCSRRSLHPYDSLGYVRPESLVVWSNLNKDTPFDIAPKSNQHRWFKCQNNKHKDYKSLVYRANNRNFECPKCHNEQNDSYLQKIVDYYIENTYSYEYLKEYDCTLQCINPDTGYILPYDRELIIGDKHLFIEVQGLQHYKMCLLTKKNALEHCISTEQEFELQKYRDKIKKDYVIKNGYEFLEIPYTCEENESYKTLIDNKILSLTIQN